MDRWGRGATSKPGTQRAGKSTRDRCEREPGADGARDHRCLQVLELCGVDALRASQVDFLSFLCSELSPRCVSCVALPLLAPPFERGAPLSAERPPQALAASSDRAFLIVRCGILSVYRQISIPPRAAASAKAVPITSYERTPEQRGEDPWRSRPSRTAAAQQGE